LLQILYQNNIKSSDRLRWTIEQNYHFLESVGFDPGDSAYLRNVLQVIATAPAATVVGGPAAVPGYVPAPGPAPNPTPAPVPIPRLVVPDPAPTPYVAPVSNAPRLAVGTRVIYCGPDVGEDYDGPLRFGDIGTLLADDRSLKPYRVRADTGLQQGAEWFYALNSIRAATPEEIAVGTAAFGQRRMFAVGDRVRIQRISVPDVEFRQQGHGNFTSDMTLMLGNCGYVVGVTPRQYYQVSVEGYNNIREWSAFMLESAQEAVPPAQTLQQPKNPQEKNPRMPTLAEAMVNRLQVGDRVTLAPGYASQDDARQGPLSSGAVGEIINDDYSAKPFKVRAEQSRQTWWYAEDALQKYQPRPAARLRVNDRVCLSTFYQDFGDAAGGPLKPGQAGIIIEDDSSDKPFKVRTEHNGLMWWYAEGALCQMPAMSTVPAGQPAVPTVPARARYSVGNQVRIRNSPANEVMTRQVGHGGYVHNMGQSVGTIGVVTRVDIQSGDCEVAGVGLHTWNSDLLELVQPRLVPGNVVALVANYADVSDADRGPLRVGEEGVVVCDDHSDKPYQVRSCSDGNKTWWYDVKALRKLRDR
jgi:hypothetical protein